MYEHVYIYLQCPFFGCKQHLQESHILWSHQSHDDFHWRNTACVITVKKQVLVTYGFNSARLCYYCGQHYQ